MLDTPVRHSQMFLKCSHIKAKSEGDLKKLCYTSEECWNTRLEICISKGFQQMFFAIYEMQ